MAAYSSAPSGWKALFQSGYVAEIQGNITQRSSAWQVLAWPIRHHWKTRKGAGKMFFGSDGLVTSVLGLTLNSLEVFFTIWQLFYFESKPLHLTQAVLQMSAMAKLQTVWQSAVTSWHFSATIATLAFARDFLHMILTTRKDPHFLLEQPRPPLII
jgi:hypothetical protein